MNTQGTASLSARPAVGKDGPATAAMVLGVTGLFTSVVLVGGALGLIGVVVGAVGLKASGRTGTGRARAVTGVVTSLLAIVVAVLAAFLLAWYANRTQACYQPDTLRQYAQCVSRHLTRS
ncbi:DUF4190 domain-containing protein [Streptomyces sp. NPDC047917]|uniref:DUF4190 domain-containing protein n=1 Tax=Streptomyces sp. NPDC047917 TaxID=3365491 RepID=UPI0037167C15